MKTKILTGVIVVLGSTVIGLATKIVFLEDATQQVAVQTGSSAESAPVKVAEKPLITKVTPNYVTKEVPTKKCKMVNQTQMVANTNKTGTTGGVIGGTTGAVAGGVIGKQISGNTTGTVIGGVVGLVGGAFAGNKIQKATQPDQVAQTNQVQQCATVNKTTKKISGYIVEYVYQGQNGSVIMKNKPSGQYLTLDVIAQKV